MKSKATYLLAVVLIFFHSACEKELDQCTNENTLTHLNNPILPGIPDSTLQTLDSLGMPVYNGNNACDLEGCYLASAFVLLSSNIPGDKVGDPFNDTYIQFENQTDSTIETTVCNSSGRGSGHASFVVGDNGYFTVSVTFLDYDTVWNDSALVATVISGRCDEGKGIVDLHYALIMLDNFGDPNYHYIDNNSVRVAIDEDGYSESVVPCPCDGARSSERNNTLTRNLILSNSNP